jgi:hypothetical protein
MIKKTQQSLEEELDILKRCLEKDCPDPAALSCAFGLLGGLLTDIKRMADALEVIAYPSIHVNDGAMGRTGL